MARRHKLILAWVLCLRCNRRIPGSPKQCDRCQGPVLGRLDSQPKYEFRPRR